MWVSYEEMKTYEGGLEIHRSMTHYERIIYLIDWDLLLWAITWSETLWTPRYCLLVMPLNLKRLFVLHTFSAPIVSLNHPTCPFKACLAVIKLRRCDALQVIVRRMWCRSIFGRPLICVLNFHIDCLNALHEVFTPWLRWFELVEGTFVHLRPKCRLIHRRLAQNAIRLGQ